MKDLRALITLQLSNRNSFVVSTIYKRNHRNSETQQAPRDSVYLPQDEDDITGARITIIKKVKSTTSGFKYDDRSLFEHSQQFQIGKSNYLSFSYCKFQYNEYLPRNGTLFLSSITVSDDAIH